MRPRAAGVPTGTLKRVCAGACPAKHAGDRDLVIALLGAPADAPVAWTVNGEAAEASAAGKLVVAPASFPAGGEPVQIVATIGEGEAAGRAALAVPVNAAPACEGACIAAPATATFGAAVAAKATGFSDDGPATDLTYEWGMTPAGGADIPLLIDQATAFTYKGLPAGEVTLYVRAIDAHGAKSPKATSALTVAAPAANFDRAAAVAAIDVARAVNTNDMTAIAAAMRSLAVVAALPAPANATAEETAALADAVDAKAVALIDATNAAANQDDMENFAPTAHAIVAAYGAMTNKTVGLATESVLGMADYSE